MVRTRILLEGCTDTVYITKLETSYTINNIHCHAKMFITLSTEKKKSNVNIIIAQAPLC